MQTLPASQCLSQGNVIGVRLPVLSLLVLVIAQVWALIPSFSLLVYAFTQVPNKQAQKESLDCRKFLGRALRNNKCKVVRREAELGRWRGGAGDLHSCSLGTRRRLIQFTQATEYLSDGNDIQTPAMLVKHELAKVPLPYLFQWTSLSLSLCIYSLILLRRSEIPASSAFLILILKIFVRKDSFQKGCHFY